MALPAPIALALAGVIATTAETLAFNSLTVWRTRVQAGRERTHPSWFHAVPIQLACLVLRRPLTLVIQANLAADGLSSFASGCCAGFLEGILFTPTRRVATLQLALDRPLGVWRLLRSIVRREGWRGLWMGWPVNALRTGLGAGVYYATLSIARAVWPSGGFFWHGALGSAAATIVLNPFEVILVLLYTGHRPAMDPSTLSRGLLLSLARNIPGGAFRWWATQTLALLFSGALR